VAPIPNEKENIVASFCAKCGSEVSPDKQFCTSCGAAAVPPVASQPVVAPAPSGSSALKIILIIIAVVVGLGVLGLCAAGYSAWRIARAFHVNGPGGQVTMSTPGGTFTANPEQSYTASELGTDIYPGAQGTKGGMRMELPTGSMVTGVFVTTDSKDQVVAFYKSKFGGNVSVFDSADGAVLTLTKGDKESVMVTVSAKPSQNDGKTQIAIVHTKSNKAS
jgi:hypothetical protein